MNVHCDSRSDAFSIQWTTLFLSICPFLQQFKIRYVKANPLYIRNQSDNLIWWFAASKRGEKQTVSEW